MAGYGDDTKFAAWLTANGYTLPADAPAPAVLRQRGSAYIDGLYGSRFSGLPAGGFAQERAFPRVGAEAYSQAIPSDLVPVAVEQASYAAGYQEAIAPGSLAPAVSAAASIKREKVSVIETEYFAGSGDAVADATVRIAVVEGLLGPFLAQPMPAVFVV